MSSKAAKLKEAREKAARWAERRRSSTGHVKRKREDEVDEVEEEEEEEEGRRRQSLPTHRTKHDGGNAKEPLTGPNGTPVVNRRHGGGAGNGPRKKRNANATPVRIKAEKEAHQQEKDKLDGNDDNHDNDDNNDDNDSMDVDGEVDTVYDEVDEDDDDETVLMSTTPSKSKAPKSSSSQSKDKSKSSSSSQSKAEKLRLARLKATEWSKHRRSSAGSAAPTPTPETKTKLSTFPKVALAPSTAKKPRRSQLLPSPPLSARKDPPDNIHNSHNQNNNNNNNSNNNNNDNNDTEMYDTEESGSPDKSPSPVNMNMNMKSAMNMKMESAMNMKQYNDVTQDTAWVDAMSTMKDGIQKAAAEAIEVVEKHRPLPPPKKVAVVDVDDDDDDDNDPHQPPPVFKLHQSQPKSNHQQQFQPPQRQQAQRPLLVPASSLSPDQHQHYDSKFSHSTNSQSLHPTPNRVHFEAQQENIRLQQYHNHISSSVANANPSLTLTSTSASTSASTSTSASASTTTESEHYYTPQEYQQDELQDELQQNEPLSLWSNLVAKMHAVVKMLASVTLFFMGVAAVYCLIDLTSVAWTPLLQHSSQLQHSSSNNNDMTTTTAFQSHPMLPDTNNNNNSNNNNNPETKERTPFFASWTNPNTGTNQPFKNTKVPKVPAIVKKEAPPCFHDTVDTFETMDMPEALTALGVESCLWMEGNETNQEIEEEGKETNESPSPSPLTHKQKQPCPSGGICFGGYLQTCFPSHVLQPSPLHDKCLLTSNGKLTLQKTKETLVSMTVDHICGCREPDAWLRYGLEVCTVPRLYQHIVNLEDEDADNDNNNNDDNNNNINNSNNNNNNNNDDNNNDSILFRVDTVAKAVGSNDQYSITMLAPFFKEEELQLQKQKSTTGPPVTAVGLSAHYVQTQLPIPLQCYIRLLLSSLTGLLWSTTTYLLSLAVTGLVLCLLHQPWYVTVLGIVSVVLALMRRRTRRRRQATRAVRELAYQRLRKRPYAEAHLRDTLAETLHPDKLSERIRFSRQIWSRVAVEVRCDSRVRRSYRGGTEWWEWADK